MVALTTPKSTSFHVDVFLSIDFPVGSFRPDHVPSRGSHMSPCAKHFKTTKRDEHENSRVHRVAKSEVLLLSRHIY